MAANPLAFNPDGTAVDPIAFRDALMADPEKLRAIEEDKELAAALLGGGLVSQLRCVFTAPLEPLLTRARLSCSR